jgi:hypothetical protein
MTHITYKAAGSDESAQWTGAGNAKSAEKSRAMRVDSIRARLIARPTLFARFVSWLQGNSKRDDIR